MLIRVKGGRSLVLWLICREIIVISCVILLKILITLVLWYLLKVLLLSPMVIWVVIVLDTLHRCVILHLGHVEFVIDLLSLVCPGILIYHSSYNFLL